MNKFKIGQTFKKEYPPEAAVWCNANNAHIERPGNDYVIVANAPAPEPTVAEQVQQLEQQTGLTRAVRELVLAENSGASEYVVNKAKEIENLAVQMRPSVQKAAAAGDISDMSL